jgi:hypothetical protein
MKHMNFVTTLLYRKHCPIRPQRLLEEEELLFAELHAAEDPIVPLAAKFALEAGCRRIKHLRVEEMKDAL